MIVLNDSTARRIANCLSVMGAGTLEKAGELAVEELIEVLETPLPEGYGECGACTHDSENENIHCAKCEDSMAFAVAIGWESK